MLMTCTLISNFIIVKQIQNAIMKTIDNQTVDIPNTKGQGKKKAIKSKCSTLSKKELRKLVRHKLGHRKMNNPSTKKYIKHRLLSNCINKHQYNCSICLQYLIYPTTLECGHSFCLPCIENFNKINTNNQCSLCRMDNQIKFHEINHKVDKIIQYIVGYKMSKYQKKDYLSRKDTLKKQYQQRGIKYNLGLNDQVKVKVKNHWVRGKISKIHGKGNNIYYDIFTYINEEINHLSKRSINIKQQQFQKIKKAKRQSNCIFSQNIFIEDHAPCRPVDNNTYNIQQLLWEVSYYEPQQPNNNQFWNFRTLNTLQNRNRQNQIIQLTSVDLE